MLNYDWIHSFVNPLPDQYAVLQRLLEQDPDQYLISNTLWLGAFPAALGAPGLRPRRWVGVTAVPLPLSSDDTSFFGPVPVGPGEDQKAANRAANAAFAAMFQPTQDHLAEVLRSVGTTQDCPGFVDGVFTVPDASAALSVAWLRVRARRRPGLGPPGRHPAQPHAWVRSHFSACGKVQPFSSVRVK
jgi:hypothetical protein